MAGAGTRTILSGGGFGDNLMSVLPDVIGNTIGNMVAGAVQTEAAEPQKVGAEVTRDKLINSDLVQYSAEELAAMLPTAVQLVDVDPSDHYAPATIEAYFGAYAPEDKDWHPIIAAGRGIMESLDTQRQQILAKFYGLPSDAANALANSWRGPHARELAPGEYKLISEALGDKIDLSNVRIVLGPGKSLDAAAAFRVGRNPAITIGDTVYINPKMSEGKYVYYSPDFSKSASGADRLIHEFTHVYQYQRLGFVSFIAQYGRDLVTYGDRDTPYRYQDRPTTTFKTETLEGQAEMVGDYARAIFNGAPPTDRVVQDLERRLKGTGIYGK